VGKAGATEADQLFWFRWITGHQVCFVLWRLVADTAADVLDARIAPGAALVGIERAVRACSAMFLYSCSCPRSVYETVIRPSMFLQHPAFSGSWAPDYVPVRTLFRGRSSPVTRHPQAGDLLEAVRLYQVVHEGAAAKLVPGGRSLLQGAIKEQPRDVRLQHLIYDNYFLTHRAPVSRHEVVAQLLRRLVAVAQDVAANGFHPAGGAGPGDLPEELRRAEVAAYEEAFAPILFEAAGYAAGLPEGAACRLPAGADLLAPSIDAR
jgi:hypothetical protein